MNRGLIIKILKVAIWLCLAVVVFSPLYINSHLFFPYIVTKTIAFNLAVELMFLIFLILVLVDPNYKLRINLPIVLLLVYLVLIFISSFLGDDFYRSFWSNNERSEGILLLLHLGLFLVVLTGFFRKYKEWLYVLGLSVVASLAVSLVALGQYLQISWLLPSSGGDRLAGTIGNAGYMAGYLIFGVFFTVFLFFKLKNNYLRWGCLVVALLELFIIINTQTRGAWVALVLSLAIFIVYLAVFYFRNTWAKVIGGGLIVLALLASVVLVANKKSEWVIANPILQRIVSISVSSTSAQNRLITWNSSWQGFKERPVFGWGYENFYQVFDKYFNPKIHDIVWYDRAHNMIFDRLVTGGILGLLAYLALLLLPFVYLWLYYFKKTNSDEPSAGSNLSRKLFTPFLFSLVIVTYLIQNMFIFEALVIYIPLFLTIAFVGLYNPHYDWRTLSNTGFKVSVLVCYVPIFLWAVYFVNVKPLQANTSLTRALSDPNITVSDRLDLFDKAFAYNTAGRFEYRRQYFDFFNQLVYGGFNDQAILTALSSKVSEQLNQQLEEDPHSVMDYLSFMRFNNTTYQLDPSRLDKNLNLADQALTLSPTRQQVYYEIGYTYLNLFSVLKQANQDDKAWQQYGLAIDKFKFAIDLDPKNLESYLQLANAYVFGGQNQALYDLLASLDKNGVTYDQESVLSKITNSALSVRNYSLAEGLLSKLLVINPQNPDYYLQLSTAQASQGQDDAAVKTAEKLKALSPQYEAKGQELISEIKKGSFKK